MTNLQHTYALILAGGGGTRLWPKSRQSTPKQFLKLTGSKTMLQLTAERLNKFIPWERIILITNAAYAQEVHKELPKLSKQNIILEPAKKDTALAMLTGALFAQALDPKAIIVNAAADHIVLNNDEYEAVMKAAVDIASDQTKLVAVGITPTAPSTAFGYIKIGKELKQFHNQVSVFQVEKFTEKPKAATARAFIATGKYFWNANMYVWSTQALKDAFASHSPDTLTLTKSLHSSPAKNFNQLLPSIYDKATSISIDYAISEKAHNLLLIPAEIGWNDIGEWEVVYQLGRKDPQGNVVLCDHSSVEASTILVDTYNNIIQTDGRLVSLLGVEDMIVIDTDQTVFIAPRSKSQEVKKMVEALKDQGKDQFL